MQDSRRSVTGVTKAQAAAYCAWAHSRLPSDAEWLGAARADCQKFPWGNDVLPASNCFAGDRGRFIVAPGSFPRDIIRGIYDLHGNVSEWTADGTVRGVGSCEAPLGEENASAREWSHDTGFRCMVP